MAKVLKVHIKTLCLQSGHDVGERSTAMHCVMASTPHLVFE